MIYSPTTPLKYYIDILKYYLDINRFIYLIQALLIYNIRCLFFSSGLFRSFTLFCDFPFFR